MLNKERIFCFNFSLVIDQGGVVKKGMLVMEKILKCVGMFMVALVLVMGVGGDADAKKKKKKYKLTDEENAMFDKWHVKPKKTSKGS